MSKLSTSLFNDDIQLRPLSPPHQTGDVGDMTAAVAGASILAFTEEMNSQQREDVLNSTLLAQFVSNQDHDRFENPNAWYKRYVNVLQKLGWIISTFSFSEVTGKTKNLRIDAAILTSIKDKASNSGLNVLKSALDGLSSLKAEDNTVTLFDSKATFQTQADFQLGVAEINEDGFLTTAFGGYRLTADKRRRRFLFFRWERHKVKFWASVQTMRLNEDYYARDRERVKSALDAHRDDNVWVIPT